MSQEWLTTAEAMTLFGWTSRSYISRVARREKWRVKKPRTPHPENRYYSEDVESFIRSRQRTDLLGSWYGEKRGRGVCTLIRDTKMDTICSLCGSFAVIEPFSLNDDPLEFAERVRNGQRKIRCINGHETAG